MVVYNNQSILARDIGYGPEKHSP